MSVATTVARRLFKDCFYVISPLLWVVLRVVRILTTLFEDLCPLLTPHAQLYAIQVAIVAIMASTSYAIAIYVGPFFLFTVERSVDAIVSHVGTQRRRKTVATMINDEGSFMYIPRGPPRAISNDVLRMMDDYLVVRFSFRHWVQHRVRRLFGG